MHSNDLGTCTFLIFMKRKYEKLYLSIHVYAFNLLLNFFPIKVQFELKLIYKKRRMIEMVVAGFYTER